MMKISAKGEHASVSVLADRIPVSVVVLAKDEEENLPRCLSALSFTDDIVVVDDFSADRTAEVSREHGARVFQHCFRSFADQRNWGQEDGRVKYDWVLHLDADEVVTPQMAAEMTRKLKQCSDDMAGFWLCFRTMFMGKWLRWSAMFPVWILRLVRRDQVRFTARGHGEAYTLNGRLGHIREPFLHYNFSKGLDHWFEKHNRYSAIEANEYMKEVGEKGIQWQKLFSRDPVKKREELKRLSFRLPFRPWLKFLYMYFLRMGFLDGLPGLTYCTLQAIYEYMICLKIRTVRRDSVL